MLVQYGHGEITWQGVKYRLAPTFANISKLGTPSEIVDNFKRFMTTCSAVWKFDHALFVLNTCMNKPLPADLTGRAEMSERLGKLVYRKPRHDLPMFYDVIALAEHCLLHGVCGDVDQSGRSTGEAIKEFDALEYIEMARIHFGFSSEEASNMTMTEFIRMFNAKFPPEKDKGPTPEQEDAMLATFE